MENDDMLLLPQVDPHIYFHLSKCNPNIAPNNSLTTLYGHSALAVQLRATNMAGCATGPLEKVLPFSVPSNS